MPSKPSLDLCARRIVVSSYLYYRHDLSMMDDHTFDLMCRRVADEWDQLDPIRQWQLESPQAVSASGYHVLVTVAAQAAAIAWVNDHGHQLNETRGAITKWKPPHKVHRCRWATLMAA